MIKSILLWLALFSSPMYGQALFHMGINYEDESVKDNTTDTSVTITRQIGTADLGVLISPNFYLGLKYYHKNEINDQTIDIAGIKTTTSTSTLTNGAGIGLGFYTAVGPMIQLSYILEPKQDDGTTEYSGGSGTIIDLGYRFGTDGFSFGPKLTQTSFTYKKQAIAGVETEIDITQSHLLPMLGFWFVF